MQTKSRKIQLALFIALLFVFSYSTGLLAAEEDSACITCHTSPETMDALVPVVTKTSSGG